MDDTDEIAEIAAELRQSYREVRILPDGSIAGLLDLMFTRAICLSMNRDGYGARFCFEDRALADRRFQELTSEDDVPEGFTARR